MQAIDANMLRNMAIAETHANRNVCSEHKLMPWVGVVGFEANKSQAFGQNGYTLKMFDQSMIKFADRNLRSVHQTLPQFR
jgi:hypothetical protein